MRERALSAKMVGLISFMIFLQKLIPENISPSILDTVYESLLTNKCMDVNIRQENKVK